MRQLFTVRFAATIAALALLLFAVNTVFASDDDDTPIVEDDRLERRIDLIAPVLFSQQSTDFAIDRDGLTRGFIDLTLSEGRVMRVAPGTPGVIGCEDIDRNRCAVFADLLGEAVLYFAILPRTSRNMVELPAVLDLDEGDAVFANGWRIPYPPVIERICDGEDIVSFSDFLRRFGAGSTSLVDVETQKVTTVLCAGQEAGNRRALFPPADVGPLLPFVPEG